MCLALQEQSDEQNQLGPSLEDIPVSGGDRHKQVSKTTFVCSFNN